MYSTKLEIMLTILEVMLNSYTVGKMKFRNKTNNKKQIPMPTNLSRSEVEQNRLNQTIVKLKIRKMWSRNRKDRRNRMIKTNQILEMTKNNKF